MMIKLSPNIGILNALIRITIGLTILSWSTAKMVRRPYCQTYLWTSLCGAMKVAEGIVRYCPVTALVQQANVSPTHQKVNGSDKSSYGNCSEFNETVTE
jgi:hypothetical protein